MADLWVKFNKNEEKKALVVPSVVPFCKGHA